MSGSKGRRLRHPNLENREGDRMPSEDSPTLLIGEMYARWTLDVVVRLVQEGIALDFVNQPRQYRGVQGDPADPNSIPSTLEGFWFRSGTDPEFTSLQKREMVLFPILGRSDGVLAEHQSEFHIVSTALRAAANSFTNRVFATGEENLRQAFRDAALTFQAYLRPYGNDNPAVRKAHAQLVQVFGKAVSVLLDRQVTGVFGRPPADASNWPLDQSFDENGALVIAYVSEALRTSAGAVAKSQFIVMQRIAEFGARTIRAVLDADFGTAAAVDDLIQFAYRWHVALAELRSSEANAAPIPPTPGEGRRPPIETIGRLPESPIRSTVLRSTSPRSGRF